MSEVLAESSNPGGVADTADRELTRGALWGTATLGVTAAAGFGFWIVAALTSTDAGDVGRAAAWFSLVQLVVMVCGVGAPILIHRSGGERSISGITGAAAATVTMLAFSLGLLAPFVAGSNWNELSGSSGARLSLPLALVAAGATLTLVVDARFVSSRAWRSVFIRSATPAIARVPLLLLDPWQDRASWIVAVALVPLAASGLFGGLVLWRRHLIEMAAPWRLSPEHRTFLGAQHVGALATQAPFHVIPLLVAGRVAGQTNAAFYLVWSIGVMVIMLPQTLTQVLLSEVSLERENRVGRIRRTLGANIIAGMAVWVAASLLSAPVLGLLGHSYAEVAPIVPWLVAAALVFGVTSVGLTEARLARDSWLTNAITWTIAVGSIGLGLLLIPGRPVWGAVTAWVAANVVAMVVAVIGVERRVIGPPTGSEATDAG